MYCYRIFVLVCDNLRKNHFLFNIFVINFCKEDSPNDWKKLKSSTERSRAVAKLFMAVRLAARGTRDTDCEVRSPGTHSLPRAVAVCAYRLQTRARQTQPHAAAVSNCPASALRVRVRGLRTIL
ncbi:hypothetical protein J6590_035238 [Homalodisca vitripennis]|nr:hypothetical protein J6590_035238 [Homalodisca vitripennis]